MKLKNLLNLAMVVLLYGCTPNRDTAEVIPSSLSLHNTLTEWALLETPLLDISGSPGEVVFDAINFRSGGDKPHRKYTIGSFEGGSEGYPRFVPAPEQENIASWIKIADSSPIQKETGYSVPLAIEIPKTAKAGGYYSYVTWGPKWMTTLIFLKVNGDTHEELELKGIRMDKGSITATIFNNGNTHLKPQGTIIVKNSSGQQEVSTPFNDYIRSGDTPSSGYVLPRMERVYISNCCLLKPGKYTAILTASYGENKKILTGSTAFQLQ